jgi:two-component system, chemotaxis family, chemotaxis protein CheY
MSPPSCQILLVEDERDHREMLRDLLEYEGFGVEVASNGREGLDRLAALRSPPGLILLDLLMPGMNGWAFLEALQERGTLSEVPVIVITAMTGQSVPLACEIVKKPIDFPKLIALVRRHCGSKAVAVSVA